MRSRVWCYDLGVGLRVPSRAPKRASARQAVAADECHTLVEQLWKVVKYDGLWNQKRTLNLGRRTRKMIIVLGWSSCASDFGVPPVIL